MNEKAKIKLIMEEVAMSDKDKLEMIRWLIDRADKLRESVSTRAAIVVSTNALLLAGTTFLLDRTISNLGQRFPIERAFLAVSMGATFLFLVLSLIYATTGIVSLWTTNMKILGGDPPEQLFINSFATAVTFSSFKSFKEGFEKTSKEQIAIHALGDLWMIQNLHYRRHQRLKLAIKLLLLAIIFFSVSIGTLFTGFFM